MPPIEELARAKINLALHVTGKRADGYHLLDSLVVFPEIGDRIEVEVAKSMSLTIEGPFAQDLSSGADNLVLKAAELLRPNGKGAAIHLTKSLPIASGIGGGSADAAAAMRALARLWSVELPDDVLSLGADVPVCLHSQPTRMAGIGEKLTPVKSLPEFWLVLVNAGREVSTPAVFQALERVDGAPMTDIPVGASLPEFVDWLAAQRNDMQAAACKNEPTIAEVIDLLAARDGCLLARMSGSGGTCFGIFATQDEALEARTEISGKQPLWWCVAAPVS